MVLTQIIEVINSVAKSFKIKKKKSQMQAKKEKAKDIVEIGKKKRNKKYSFNISLFFLHPESCMP